MDRRDFMLTAGVTGLSVLLPPLALAQAAAARYQNLLVLIELKGGNDGLNTVIPYADAEYYRLRPRIAIPREQVLQLDAQSGLHPALQPLLPLWESRELAVVQGVGYPSANLSHFRSIEIWDTASRSDEYLPSGWLTRAFKTAPVPAAFAADGVIVGSNELGPLGGAGTRAVALASPEQFLRQARLAAPAGNANNAALAHILKVEQDIVQAASGLSAGHAFTTEFPVGSFGNAIRAASQVAASSAPVAVIRVTLNGFDTHGNQLAVQQRLLQELATGIAVLRSALVEIDRWNSTLVMTYAEFGRRPRENQSGGTDHGTASAHFVAGGRVKGGLYGARPALTQLDGNGNLPFAVDFRGLYATVLERWWGVPSQLALNGRFTGIDCVRA